MADCSAAQITIGGWIPRRIVPRLCYVIRQERLALEWGEKTFEPRSAVELLAGRKLIDGERVLRLCDEDARYGEFAALEMFLRKHQIPFDRRTEGHFSYPSCLAVYRPVAGQRTYLTSNEGQVVVHALPLWEIQERLTTLVRLTKRASRPSIQDHVLQTLSIIRQELPERPTPLEALEVGRSIGLRNAA